MIYKYKCNICGCMNTDTDINNDLFCKSCNHKIDKELCNISEKNEKYYIHEIEIALMNEEYDNVLKLVDELELLNKDNLFVKIYKSDNKLEEWLKYQTIDFDLDLILRYDLNKNINKDLLINSITTSNINKKEQYLSLLNNNLEKKEDLLEKVNKSKVEYYINKKEKKIIYIFPYIIIGIAVAFSLIMIILGNTIISKDCNYACIVLLDIIPSILFTIAILKLLKLEKLYIGIPLFIIIFLLTSYMFTLNLHPAGFIESIKYHFERIIYSFSDIAKSIDSKFEALPDDTEA